MTAHRFYYHTIMAMTAHRFYYYTITAMTAHRFYYHTITATTAHRFYYHTIMATTAHRFKLLKFLSNPVCTINFFFCFNLNHFNVVQASTLMFVRYQ
jgi:hypothetical protein